MADGKLTAAIIRKLLAAGAVRARATVDIAAIRARAEAPPGHPDFANAASHYRTDVPALCAELEQARAKLASAEYAREEATRIAESLQAELMAAAARALPVAVLEQCIDVMRTTATWYPRRTEALDALCAALDKAREAGGGRGPTEGA